MKKALNLMLVLILLFSAAPVQAVTVNGTPVAELFGYSSTAFDRDLAIFAAELSQAAESETPGRMQDYFSRIGIDYDHYRTYRYGNEQAFCIAYTPLNADENLLIIVARGSTVTSEFIQDFGSTAKKQFFGYSTHGLVYDFHQHIMDGLNSFLTTFPNADNCKRLKVLITGHSLGGAAANLVAARFDLFAQSGAWWSGMCSKEDIYCYTFGAINSLEKNELVTSGFENIHNVYNTLDTFGPNRVGSLLVSGMGGGYGKFGHRDTFTHNFEADARVKSAEVNLVNIAMGSQVCQNHNIEGYIDALNWNIVKSADRCVVSNLPVNVTSCYANQTVRIKSIESGQYVCGELGETVHADGNCGNAGIYTVSNLTDDGWIGFKVQNGKWVSVQDDEVLKTTGDTRSAWECFRIYSYKGNHYLLAQKNNALVQVSDGAGRPLKAVRPYGDGFAGATWERFRLELVSASGGSAGQPCSTEPVVTYVEDKWIRISDYDEGYYTGVLKNGVPDGYGRLTYGDFADGKYYSLLFSDASECKALYYEGYFQSGSRNGVGKVQYEGGYMDEGTFYGKWSSGKTVFEGKRWLVCLTHNGYWPLSVVATSGTASNSNYGEWVSDGPVVQYSVSSDYVCVIRSDHQVLIYDSPISQVAIRNLPPAEKQYSLRCSKKFSSL